MRKAQVTIFIIVGIVVLVLLGAVFYIISLNRPIDTGQSIEQKAVRNYIQKCLEETLHEGAVIEGIRGGHIDLPQPYFDGAYKAAYGVLGGKDRLPTIAQMEADLSFFTSARLQACVTNITQWSVTSGTPKAKVTILSESVVAEVSYPIEISGTSINSWSAEIMSPLGRLHDIASKMIAAHIRTPDWIALDVPADVKSSMARGSDDTLLITLAKDDLLFMFAEKMAADKPPVLSLPKIFLMARGELWQESIDCIDPEGEDVSISDDSALTDLVGNQASAMPEVLGDFHVTFTCIDTHGNRAYENATLRVMP